jgi:hypothetical protein
VFWNGWTADGSAAYLVPSERPRQGDELLTNLREFPIPNAGKVVRVELGSTFQVTGSLDLAQTHAHLAGFSGAVAGTPRSLAIVCA